MMDPLITRSYRYGRSQYGLNAEHALSYARDKVLVFQADTPLWGIAVDDDTDGGLVAFIYDEPGFDTTTIYDTVGGIDMQHTVSDHGNLIVDQADPYLVGIWADMTRAWLCDEWRHDWGPVEHGLFTGNPHRRCRRPGCTGLTLDLTDDQEDDDGNDLAE